MGNWTVTFQYNADKLVAKYGSTCGVYPKVDIRFYKGLKKSEVEPHLRNIMKYSDCIDIIKIENTEKYEARFLAEHPNYKES